MATQEQPQENDVKKQRKQIPRNTLGSNSEALREAKRILEERESKENTKTGPKSPTKQEAIQIPNAIKNLSEGDLVMYAGERGYREHFIIQKDTTDNQIVFTVTTKKRNPDGTFTDIPQEKITATEFTQWFYQKSLVFSKEHENLTMQEEKERVLKNLENKKKYHEGNKEKNPEYQKTTAFMDTLIQEQKESIPKDEHDAKVGILEEMKKGLHAVQENLTEKIKTKEFKDKEAIAKIAELFADPNFTFPPLATHGSEFRGKKGAELREEYPTEYQLTPDTDAQIALELLQEAIGMTKKNTESEKGQNYFQSQLKEDRVPSQVIMVPKGQYAKGAINIDTGGKQGIVLEQKTYKDDVLSNTIWIDHHGTEKAMLTSATALMLKFIKEIPQLNFKHEAQEKQWENVAHFVTSIDNMTFPTNAKFVREDYARTLYGLYKDIPTADLIRELKNNGAQKVYTEKELEEKGWLQASKVQQFKVDISMGKQPGKGGIEEVKKNMTGKRFAPETPELGRYLFENYREYNTENKPKNPLGFVGVKASGMDSHITLQPGGGFFISSLKDLNPVYERLITAIPEIKDQVVLVRGTMIAYDPRRTENAKSVTEREIMSALDLFKKMEQPVAPKKPAQPARRPEKPKIATKRHIPGKRREDNPIPDSVQRFLTETNINPTELRFHTLETKSALEHFDPKVKILSDEQRKFVEAVQKVAKEMNIQPEPKETLGGFITRISKAA